MREETLLSVVYLGLDDFPFGLAETHKMRLVSKGLLQSGCRVKVVSRSWNCLTWEQEPGMKPSGVFDGIEYFNASGTLYRPGSWLLRKRLRVLGYLNEIMEIRRLRKAGRLSAAIVSTPSSWRLLYYKLWSVVFGFPIFVLLGEMRSAVREPTFLMRMNALVFDRYAIKAIDGILPISEYLVAHAGKYAPRVPCMKVPVLVDVRKFDHASGRDGRPYFLFCAGLEYLEIVRFILRAFDRSHTGKDMFLHLVVNGTRSQFAALDAEVSGVARRESVKVFSKLSDEELYAMLRGAYGLLIPLRPTIKDIARFPHKIGEYCASGRPIVTTNVGEIRTYFENHKTAFIAESYNEEEYAAVMDEVLSNPERADEVGKNGRLLAEREFDYHVYGPRIKRFIQQIIETRGVHLRVHDL